jgi:hypothetical protein
MSAEGESEGGRCASIPLSPCLAWNGEAAVRRLFDEEEMMLWGARPRR